MADHIGAGGDAVGQDIGPVVISSGSIVHPHGDAGRVYLHRSAHMTTGAGRTTTGYTGQALAVAVDVGTGGDPAFRNISRMVGISVIAPGNGVDMLLVPHVALGAGNLGNSTGIVAAVAFGASGYVGRGRGAVTARQPVGGNVCPAVVGGEGALGVLITTAHKSEGNEHRQP